MAFRGALLRPRFGAVHGLLLIGRGTRLQGLGQVHAGRLLRIEDEAEVNGTSLRGMTFGDQVTIGTGSIIRASNTYGRLLGVGLTIGSRSSLGPGCFIGCSGGVTVGSDVMFGPGVRVFSETHVVDSLDSPIKSQGIAERPTVIEDDCWIGAGAIVVGGVTVGAGSVIGAGSVVTKDVPPRSIVAGNPSRLIRER
jgi:acetyltransferase-like isoleucine patch superfamily enzyme